MAHRTRGMQKDMPSPCGPRLAASLIALVALGPAALAGQPDSKPARTWPQAYSVQSVEKTGSLVLCTPYYTVEHDMKKGGAITRIALTHGKAANLLVRPIETRVRDDQGVLLSDLKRFGPERNAPPRGNQRNRDRPVHAQGPERPGLGVSRDHDAGISLGLRQGPQAVCRAGRRSPARSLPDWPRPLPPASPSTATGKG